MIRWDAYFRVIKQTPSHDTTYHIIEMTTGVVDYRKDISRRWEATGWGHAKDNSLWVFAGGSTSEERLIACKFGHQDWYARDYNCGDPDCGKDWGSSAHTRIINAFCSNDDGFNITSKELYYMFATELQRVSTAYLDAVSKDTGLSTMEVVIHHDTQDGYNKSDDDNNGGCK